MSTSLKLKTERALSALEDLRVSARSELSKHLRLLWGAGVLAIAILLSMDAGFQDLFRSGERDAGPQPFDPVSMVILSSLVIVLGFGSFFLWNRARKRFVLQSKERFVRPLMLEIFPNLLYEPEGKMDKKTFDACGLYQKNYNRYSGDDLFQGIVNDRLVEFSELNVYRESSSKGQGGSKTEVFEGLFMRVELNKRFTHRIVIDAAKKQSFLEEHGVPSFVMNLMQRFTPNYGPKLETGIAGFDDLFEVFSANEEEARSLLTQEFSKQLMEIHVSVQKASLVANDKRAQLAMGMSSRFKMSIEGNSLYFALPSVRLFDFSLRESVEGASEVLSESFSRIEMMTRLAAVC